MKKRPHAPAFANSSAYTPQAFLIPPLHLRRIVYRTHPLYRHTFTLIVIFGVALVLLLAINLASVSTRAVAASSLRTAKNEETWATERIASLESTRTMLRQIEQWNLRTGVKVSPILAAVEKAIPATASLIELSIPRLEPRQTTPNRTGTLLLTLYYPVPADDSSVLDDSWVAALVAAMDAEAGLRTELDVATAPERYEGNGCTRAFSFKFQRLDQDALDRRRATISEKGEQQSFEPSHTFHPPSEAAADSN